MNILTDNEIENKWRAEVSLYEFLKQAWASIEGDIKFIDSWHIKAIAEHLEAAFKREIKNLLINVPPRSSKTSLISVAFPTWVWIHNPQEKFMYASYAGALSLEHSLKCRRLIESEWYQRRWGDRYKLARDQNAKGFFENTKGGYRIATSVGAASTGRGASMLICDDVNSTGEGTSEAKRNAANNWLSQVWSTRLNDPAKDVKISVQQRVHENDASGYILANDNNKEWVRLILPMEFEVSRKSQTFINGKLWWEDPRRDDGELLSPRRFSIKEIERYKQDLGSYGYAGQYQQRPSPAEGGIIKKHWFKLWKYPIPSLELVIQSWDTALTAKDTSSYSACTTWGAFYDANGLQNIILLSTWRGKIEYPELRERAKRLAYNYFDTDEKVTVTKKSYRPDVILVEAKASGDPLIQDLRRAGVLATPFMPNKYGDKIQRVRLVTPLIENGTVWVPTKPPSYDRVYNFVDEFLESIATFPNTDSRDLVDTMTQGLLKFRDMGAIAHRDDEKFVEKASNIRVY